MYVYYLTSINRERRELSCKLSLATIPCSTATRALSQDKKVSMLLHPSKTSALNGLYCAFNDRPKSEGCIEMTE